MPEFYTIFALKMTEFYIIIARKIFFPNFGGHEPPTALFSYAYARITATLHLGRHSHNQLYANSVSTTMTIKYQHTHSRGGWRGGHRGHMSPLNPCLTEVVGLARTRPAKIRAVQIFNALHWKYCVKLNKRPTTSLLLLTRQSRLLLYQAQSGPEKPHLYFLIFSVLSALPVRFQNALKHAWNRTKLRM